MEYQDEKLAEIKRKKCVIEHSNIKGNGMYINNQFIKFHQIEILDSIVMYMPEEFIDMPETVISMKYPSTNRPKVIKTSLTTTTNFCFNLFPEQVTKENAGEYAMQLKEVIKKVNPSFRFLEEHEEVNEQGDVIEMFDFISYGMDEQIYNMMCLIPLHNGTLQAIFNCLDRESEDWKEAAWKAFLTVEERDSKKRDGR